MLSSKSSKTNTGDRQPTKAVLYISGPNRLGNELLANSLKSNLSLTCSCSLSENLSKIPERSNDHKILIFYDFSGFQQQEVGSWLTTNLDCIKSGHLVIGFNLDPSIEIEHLTIQYGLKGIIYNDQPLEIFGRAAEAVLNGELWYPRAILEALLIPASAHPPSCAGSSSMLTKREWEVLKLVSLGMKNHEIAEKEFISPHTVKNHAYNLFKKIKVNNRFQAARWLHENG